VNKSPLSGIHPDLIGDPGLFSLFKAQLNPQMESTAFFTNDAIVLGLLMVVLGFIFYTSHLDHPFWKKLYTFLPPLLLCYFLPALLNWPLGLISDEGSGLYNPMASRYLLPAALVLLCLSIDLKGIFRLGWRSVVMFLAATTGIILGGPLALIIVSKIAPGIFAGDGEPLWKGLSTVAGSWIGGGANQTAMKEIFEVSDKLFSSMVVIDVVVANIWMGFLLYGAGISGKLDKWFKADSSAIDDLKERVSKFQASVVRVPSTTDIFIILAIAFGATALSHWGADVITPFMKHYEAGLTKAGLTSLMSPFFWLIVIATTAGLILSFTPLKKYEGAGASKFGSVFIYILVATIGMKMNIAEVFDNLDAFLIGFVWMLIHVTILLTVAKVIRAPFFFVAVGSQANVGGAASAPIVASAFSPSLAPVGVLMAVLGYALGTYGALICAFLMEWVTP
jgi:uncharacterized membrane protein